MDYEKKYKEALEKARPFIEHPLQEDSSNTYFPELNESKSIRLWLIDLLSTMQYHHCDEDMEMGNKALAWLESLKARVQPLSQWKPSDEQMKALDIALKAGIQLGTWEEKALRELKEQLKKL